MRNRQIENMQLDAKELLLNIIKNAEYKIPFISETAIGNILNPLVNLAYTPTLYNNKDERSICETIIFLKNGSLANITPSQINELLNCHENSPYAKQGLVEFVEKHKDILLHYKNKIEERERPKKSISTNNDGLQWNKTSATFSNNNDASNPDSPKANDNASKRAELEKLSNEPDESVKKSTNVPKISAHTKAIRNIKGDDGLTNEERYYRDRAAKQAAVGMTLPSSASEKFTEQPEENKPLNQNGYKLMKDINIIRDARTTLALISNQLPKENHEYLGELAKEPSQDSAIYDYYNAIKLITTGTAQNISLAAITKLINCDKEKEDLVGKEYIVKFVESYKETLSNFKAELENPKLQNFNNLRENNPRINTSSQTGQSKL
jgi:hypothetical protein